MNEPVHKYIIYFLVDDDDKQICSENFISKNRTEVKFKLLKEYRQHRIYILAICRLY